MTPQTLPFYWINGRLVPRELPTLPAHGAALLSERGCFTTARAVGGRVLYARRHAARLARDAENLGIGSLDTGVALEALHVLARAAFGVGEGQVRLQAGRDDHGNLHLLGIPAPLGDDPSIWTATTATELHPGPSPTRGAKCTARDTFEQARCQAKRHGAQEALFCDRTGYLVEGARSNLFAVLDSGRLITPPLKRGGVRGVARAILLEHLSDASECDLHADELPALRELIAVNALRGARPILAVDGKPVGSACPGAEAARLARVLALAAEDFSE